MKTLLRCLGRLYPSWWRRRYGAELEALLEDARPGLSGGVDILKGAFVMQISSLTAARLIVLCALTGALLAFAFSLTLPQQWRSDATFQISGNSPDMAATVNKLANTVLSPASLTRIIRDGGLYGSLPDKLPMDDVIEKMKRDIHIQRAGALADASASTSAFTIHFIYEDRVLAQKALSQLVATFVDANMSEGQLLRIVETASLPGNPVRKPAAAISGIGSLSGLIVGVLIAAAMALFRRRRPPERPSAPNEM
jgi:hypothetical protein